MRSASSIRWSRSTASVAALLLPLLAPGMPAAVRAQSSTPAQSPAPTTRPCRLQGRVTSGELALPGATVTVKAGERVVGLTSTDLDGAYTVALAPGTYAIRVELTPFAPIDREITLGTPPCESTADMK